MYVRTILLLLSFVKRMSIRRNKLRAICPAESVDTTYPFRYGPGELRYLITAGRRPLENGERVRGRGW